MTQTDTSAPPTSRLKAPGWEVLVLVCAAQFMVILDISIVNVALPSIRTDLDFSEAGLQWVVNAYTLTFGGLLLLGGRAGDLLGRKRMFVAGIGVFSVASLAGALAPSQETLVAARALQGVGGAIVAPSTLALLTTTFREGPERTRALGLWGLVAGVGGSLGGLVGGVLTDAFDWRWIFYVNVPVGAAIVWRSLRDLPAVAGAPDPAGARGFDLAGALAITAGLGALVFGIVRTESEGWGSPQSLGSIVLGVALIAAFVVIERRQPRPLVPLRIFGSRQLTAANVAVFLLGASLFAMWFFLSLYMQQVLGFTPTQAGLAFLPMALLMGIGASQAARVVARAGVRATLTAGFVLLTAGMMLLTRIDAGGSWAADVLAPSVVLGAGTALCFVPLTTVAMSGVAPHEQGLASGHINVSRQMGGALGLAVLATVATARATDRLEAAGGRPSAAQLQDALTAGYQRSFAIAALITLAGAFAVLILVRDSPVARAGQARLAEPGRPAAESRTG